MKRFVLLCALLILMAGLAGKNLLAQPESVVRDDARQRWLVSNKKTGDIVTIDDSGNQSYLCRGLTSIRGLAIVDEGVYCASSEGVVGIDLATGDEILRVVISEASFLNDITAALQGVLYVSDSNTASIWRVDINTGCSALLSDGSVPGVNGLYFDAEQNRLLATSSLDGASIQQVDLTTGRPGQLVALEFGYLDGLTSDGEGRWYVSSWQAGAVYRLAADFSNCEVFADGYNGPADIYYSLDQQVLAVPVFNANRLDLLEVSPTTRQRD